MVREVILEDIPGFFEEIILEDIPQEVILEDIPEPIGFGEAFIERPLEKIPFSPVGAVKTLKIVESAKRLQNKSHAPTMEDIEREYPNAFQADKEDILRNSQQLYDSDLSRVSDYLIEMEEKQRRGYSLGGRVGQITSEMPAFMIEFMATGGLQKLGNETAKQAGIRILGRYAATTAGKAALAAGGFAIGTATRAAGMPHRAVEAILKRQLPEDIQIDDEGNIEIIGSGEKPFTSLWKGLTDHYIEIASEQAGEIIGPVASKYFNKLPMMGKFTGALQKRWLKLNPGKTAEDFAKKTLTKGGFHGVIAEVGEEYLGDTTRAIFNIDDFGAGKDAGMFERMAFAVKQDTENLPAMLISFSIPGAAGKAIDVYAAKQAAKIKEAEDTLRSIAGLEINTPTQIETAEGTIGYEDDFFIEKWQKGRPDYKFETAGLGKWFTPKWLVNRIIGAEILLEDVEQAELARSLEESELNKWTSQIIKKLKKEKELTRLFEDKTYEEILRQEQEDYAREFEPEYTEAELESGSLQPVEFPFLEGREAELRRLRAKLTSKNSIHIMRDLLDTYEEAPPFLSESESNIFRQIRELTRYFRQRANMVREKMGLEPINKVEGYITHWMDSISNRVVNKDLPIHSGYLYWLMRGLPKEVKNPTAMKRTVKEKMSKYFSKNLGKLLRTMIAYDLKDIYLMRPYQAAWDELQRLRKERLIPDSVYQEIEKYLLYDIRKHKTPTDKAFNAAIKKPVDFLNKLISPLGKVITDPSRSVFSGVRRLAHVCGLGFRLRPSSRNLGQRLLLLDLYRGADYAKAQAVAFGLAEMPIVKHPVTNEDVPLIDLVREQDWYKAALHKFEDIAASISGVEQASLYLYSKTHIGSLFLSNVEVSALAGYFDWLNLSTQSNNPNSSHYKHCLVMSKKLNIPISELLTQKGDMMWHLREAVRRTQWEYFSISMPTFYRSQFNRAMGVFQSWWMNYFFNHCRECVNQVLTGRNSLGRAITPYGRLRALKGMGTIVAIGKTMKTTFGIEMLKYLFMPLPGYLPPIPELITGIIQYFAADDDRDRKRAANKIKYGLKFWIPFSAFVRDLNKLLSGEYSIADFLFYRPKEKK